jgi:hypothetical protein
MTNPADRRGPTRARRQSWQEAGLPGGLLDVASSDGRVQQTGNDCKLQGAKSDDQNVYKGVATMTRRAKWIAALATLALAGASSGVALAGQQTSPTLRLSVAATSVTYEEGASITAHYDTALDGQLWLDVIATTDSRCEHTVMEERVRTNHEGEVIRERVKGRSSSTATFRKRQYGRWFACGYLGRSPDSAFAHGRATWEMVKKK